MKLACFLFLICTAFSTENENKNKNLLQPQKQSDKCSPDAQKQKQNRAQNLKNRKIPRPLAVNKSRLEPQNSFEMKNKLSNAFPNETSVKVFRNMETNEISWKDGNNLVPIEKKAEIEIWLQQKAKKRPLNQKGEEVSWQQKAEEMSNCLFDRVCKWYPPEEAMPFFKELMFVVSENVHVKRRGKGLAQNNPLMIAARIGADDAIVKLIERNANVKAVDNDGRTAMHNSALYGRVKSSKIFQENGANLNAQDKWGNTPLMLAAQNGKVEVVKLLLSTGADPKMTNKNSNTAMKLARLCNHQNCVEIIKTHMEMPAKIEN